MYATPVPSAPSAATDSTGSSGSRAGALVSTGVATASTAEPHSSWPAASDRLELPVPVRKRRVYGKPTP
jgi:hypothetical protein